MKTKHIILLTIFSIGYFFYNAAQAAPIKIAVIDTGFDFKAEWAQYDLRAKKLKRPKLCASGHKDFTGSSLQDNHGHGTHIAGLIAKYAKGDYCLIILKVFEPADEYNTATFNTVQAINYALSQKVDIINYSGGGGSGNTREKLAVLRALNQGIIFVAAAGNKGENLDTNTYYPAMHDPRIIVVGNGKSRNIRHISSNYNGPIDIYAEGLNSYSILPKGKYGYMTGTSQSTAVVTGKIVYKVYKCKKLNIKDLAKCSKILGKFTAR